MSHQSDSTGRSALDRSAPDAASPPRAPDLRPDSASLAQPYAPGPAPQVSTGLKSVSGERRSSHFPTSPNVADPNTPVRPFGVQSILNPPSDHPLGSADNAPLPPRPPPAMLSPRGRKRTDPASPTHRDVATTSGQPRRMLTPKSPSLRAASLGATVLPSIHAISSETPQPLMAPSEPRVYTAEPGVAGVPALPPISTPQRPYPPIQRYTTQAPSAPLSSTYPASSLANPNRDIGLSRPLHTTPPEYLSPPFRHKAPPPPPSTDLYGSVTAPSGFKPESLTRGPRDGYRAGQSSYQMTLDTDQGPMVVPVELDLQQASKVADEKRKRNAGASARFRARRKEKEKEASHTIASLKHDIEELRAQRDFYREERDIIRDFAARHVVTVPLPIRPTSPISYHGADEGPDSPDRDPSRSDSGPATQRRRTEEYQQPPHHSPPRPDPSPLHEYGRSYLPPPGGTLQPSPQAAAGAYPPHGEGQHHPGSSRPPALGPRSQSSYDLFRREPFERTWDQSR